MAGCMLQQILAKAEMFQDIKETMLVINMGNNRGCLGLISLTKGEERIW